MDRVFLVGGLRSKAASWLVAAVATTILASCGSSAVVETQPADASGDEVLDCATDEVVQSVPGQLFGESEEAVVQQALSTWLDDGAVLLPPQHEAWAAAIDGRDVALALPELNGDGRWTVHDLTTCGPPRVGAATVDGDLDCANDRSWSQQASVDPADGRPSAHFAIRNALVHFETRHGGEIVLVSDRVGSLVVEQREQVVGFANEVASGAWVVDTVIGCEGFER